MSHVILMVLGAIFGVLWCIGMVFIVSGLIITNPTETVTVTALIAAGCVVSRFQQ